MLHRAASNAYSWWWASHIKTKQSKWLEQNLQDMEEKVKYMLKLIEEDGDSFAKRAEMYYRKRPELINFVEESYKAYRALAERYEHISGELQNANTTIATIFPEQVQFALDEEDEDGSPKITPRPFDPDKRPKGLPEIPNPYIPKVPKIPKKDSKVLPTLLKNKVQSKKTTNSTSSQKSKAGALEKLDKLQKGILALQTEKEFVKGSYESRFANYWEIEKRITEMQEEVCGLQDEFNVGMIIEDDEARTLMAATALKSCQETLIQLQEKQERSAEETRLEQQRIKAAHEKLESLKDEFLNNRMDQQMLPEKEPITEDPTLKNVEQERLELESLREKICQHFETNSAASLDVAEVAEKIDELVTKVIGLETAVSSQTSLIKRLRLETDELHAKLQGLEENKETLIKGSNNLNEKLKELEGELHAIEDLNKNVEDQNNNLQTHFTEAHCNFEYVSDKLKCAKELEEGVENRDPLQAEWVVTPNVESHKDFKEQEETTGTPFVESVSTIDNIKEVEDDRGINLSVKDQEKHDSSETEDSVLHVEPHEQDEEDQPNWKQLFLNGLEDREKILLGEYTSILRNYKEAKKKLCESERKNRDSNFETTVQIKELKSANDMKDEEIRSLRQKLNILQTSCDKNSDTHLSESKDLKMRKPTDEMVDGLISESSNIPKMNSDEKQVFNMLEDQNVEETTRLNESNVEEQEEIKVILADKPQTVSTIEEKFRRDIDELLEENLEFWLRFSASFHQIQKIQTTVQDLRGECSRLKGKKTQQESTTMDQSLRSDARSIYKHLREIQTELTLWMEQSALLKDELKCRFSSLCKIQEEISRVLKASSETEDVEFTSYQAAKFQGEVLNMQQENNKVADELQAGLDHGKGFQFEIEKTLSKLNEDFKVSVSGSGSKNHHKMKHSISQTRIPLRSFIFGNKQKKHKPKIFLWMNPTLNKQISDQRGGFQM